MAKYCSHCGREVNENAVVCINCGCAIQQEANNSITPTPKSKPKAGTVLGILGIVFAWLFALVGHALSIIGIITGIKEYKNENKMSGLILSIIGEVCAILSSVIGAVIGAALF